MSARTSSQIAAKAEKALRGKRAASVAAAPVRDSKHGREIYVYSHLQTKQVVYSLKRNVKVWLSPNL
jgi:hypothetical protein